MKKLAPLTSIIALILLTTLLNLRAMQAQTANHPSGSDGQAKSSKLIRNRSRSIGGTINIILANKNGLVAVTDSMLSWANGNSFVGEKLFQIDDHTLCTIAGWYSKPGPSVDGRIFPAYAAVPSIIHQYIQNNPNLADESIEKKARDLGSILDFTLEMVQTISGDTSPPEKSVIMLASFEQGYLKTVRVEFEPSLVKGSYRFTGSIQPTTSVGDKLTVLLAGQEFTANQILEGSSVTETDPVLKFFFESKENDGGGSITLDDLKQVGRIVESRTALKKSQVVGGLIQMGVIENGKATIVNRNAYISDIGGPTQQIFRMIENVAMGNWTHNPALGGVQADDPVALLALNMTIKDLAQGLDRIFFYSSTFEHCTLFYDGSPISILDNSNTITNSVLVLRREELMNTPFIKAVRRDYPDLPIKIGSFMDYTSKMRPGNVGAYWPMFEFSAPPAK